MASKSKQANQAKQLKQSEESILDLESLTLFRGDDKVLRDFDWKIKPGEHWAVMGPNGCGKSTLMATLQGRLWPAEGRLRVLGDAFGEADLTELRKRIGWVGKDMDYRLRPEESAWDIVSSGAVGSIGLLFDRPTSRDRRRASDLLGELFLGDMRDRPFGKLSQGQQRLVTIARAMMTSPRLLILDEPASGLDPVARELFLGVLEGVMVGSAKPAIIYVTHHSEEILPSISHVLLMRRGESLYQGPKAMAMSRKNLSELFECPVKVTRREGRWYIRMLRLPQALGMERALRGGA